MTTSKRDPRYLLDANVLIALLTPEHTLHERARKWFRHGVPFATCPITQGALLRFLMRWSEAPSIGGAKLLLQGLSAHRLHQFWPDDVSYERMAEKGVRGHRQVTDAYLVALAAAHGGRLATMDEGLSVLHANAVLIG